MEEYTLETTKLDFVNNRISKEEFDLIYSFIKARDKYNLEEDKLRDYYKNKFANRINLSRSKQELKNLKEELRTMPSCASKVLLFRHIIMKENENI